MHSAPLGYNFEFFISPFNRTHMNVLDIKKLSFSSKARICWGFFWRGIIVSLGSALCGGLLGGIAGFILGFAGLHTVIPAISGALGAIAGVFFLYVFVLWVLSSRIGSFRLALIHVDEQSNSLVHTAATR